MRHGYTCWPEEHGRPRADRHTRAPEVYAGVVTDEARTELTGTCPAPVARDTREPCGGTHTHIHAYTRTLT